jgi:hypothetical protein
MKASRKLTRRSFAASVLGGAVIGGTANALLSGRANAQNVRYTGVTDCDNGSNHDRPGYGTGDRTQYTDNDTGPNADPRCHGRAPNSGSPTGTQYDHGLQPETGCSDSDRGPYGDPSGHGQTCRGDVPNSRSTTPSGCTDSDAGSNADPIGDGRHCAPQ